MFFRTIVHTEEKEKKREKTKWRIIFVPGSNTKVLRKVKDLEEDKVTKTYKQDTEYSFLKKFKKFEEDKAATQHRNFVFLLYFLPTPGRQP